MTSCLFPWVKKLCGTTLNPIALRNTKIVYNFGLSECNRVQLISFKSQLQLRRKAKMKMAELLPLKVYVSYYRIFQLRTQTEVPYPYDLLVGAMGR